jgi:branched-chain amino acid transport system substrate-binding protein
MNGKKIAIVLVVLVLIAAGIYYVQRTSEDDQVIRIGAILPLSGPFSWLGVNEQEGMTLAAEDINSRGGINGKKINIKYEDSKGQPTDGASAVQKLLDLQNAKFIFTSLTGVTRAVMPIVEKRAATLISLTMDESIPVGTKNVLRVYPGIREEGQAMLTYTSHHKPVRAAIVYYKQAALEAQAREILEPGLRAMGVKHIIMEMFDRDDVSSLRGIAVKFKAFKPDTIFIGAYYNQIPVLLKVFGENALLGKARIISGVNFANAINLGNTPKELMEGAIVAYPAYGIMSGEVSQLSGESKRFAEMYRAKHGKSPNYDIAYGYDAMKILADAISRVGTDPGQVNKELRRPRNYEGAVGKMQVLDDGNTKATWSLAVVKNGRMEPLKRKGE